MIFSAFSLRWRVAAAGLAALGFRLGPRLRRGRAQEDGEERRGQTQSHRHLWRLERVRQSDPPRGGSAMSSLSPSRASRQASTATPATPSSPTAPPKACATRFRSSWASTSPAVRRRTPRPAPNPTRNPPQGRGRRLRRPRRRTKVDRRAARHRRRGELRPPAQGRRSLGEERGARERAHRGDEEGRRRSRSRPRPSRATSRPTPTRSPAFRRRWSGCRRNAHRGRSALFERGSLLRAEPRPS